tara:strand:+ start:404 stop:961 length:558 start_codon:yes stop_codon:yes gene_type:complete
VFKSKRAWRCEDSLSLRKFLGLSLTDSVPDYSSLTRIRDRFPVEVTERVFAFVLQMACERRLISGTQAGVDSTLLEASAAMQTIVRRETGEDCKDYLRRLMREKGVIDDNDNSSDEELRRFDRKRKVKNVSNTEWKSSSDEDARIVKKQPTPPTEEGGGKAEGGSNHCGLTSVTKPNTPWTLRRK